MDKSIVFTNISKLNKTDDVLLYSLYILQLARRLYYRNVKITNETDINILNEPSRNYLIVSSHLYKLIYNDCRTGKIYGQQLIPIQDKHLSKIIDHYITKRN